MCISGKSLTSARRPLEGRSILVTRAAEQAGELTRQLTGRGALVVECPTIAVVAPEQWDELDSALAALDTIDWIILTSVNGVRFFFDRLQQLGLTVATLKGCKLCVVGPRTAAAVLAQGMQPDLVPGEFTGEGVVAAFSGVALQGARVLFPKADGARDLIPQRLRAMGAQVLDPVVYRTVMPPVLPPEARQALEAHRLDAAIFSSPSTVRNLAKLTGGAVRLQTLLAGVAVASIGPVTSQACRTLGLEVALEPQQATLDAVLDSLERYFGGAVSGPV